MTVSNQTSNETYNGNGVTTVWDLPFRFFTNSDIQAYLVDPASQNITPLVQGTDYTLTGAGLPEQFGTAPGKITTTVPVASLKQLYVERVMAIDQLTDIVNQGRFFPEVHEDVFDRLTMLIQQSYTHGSGAIRVALTDPEPPRLPSAVSRANLLMGFDSFGNPVPVSPIGGSSADLALMLLNSSDSTKGSSMLGFLPSGANAIGRTVQSKLREIIHLTDYTTLAAAKTAAGNKTVYDAEGVSYKDVFNVDSAVFTEATDPLWKSANVNRQFGFGTHVGSARIAQGLEFHPEGSGANGPSNSDYGSSVSVIKQDWFNTTKGGEIDGLNITIRQGGRMGGGVQSDCAGTLANIGIVHGTGWAAAHEAQTSTFNAGTAAVQLQVQTAMGILDSVTNTYYGFTTTANVGTLNAAYFANLGSGTFTNFLEYHGAGGVELFKVDASGRITLRQAGDGATPTKTIRALSGSLSILNDAQSTQIMSLSDAGSMTIPGSHDALAVAVRGAAFAGGAAVLVMGNGSEATATAGGSGALPATVAGYFIWNYNNIIAKVPFYAN